MSSRRRRLDREAVNSILATILVLVGLTVMLLLLVSPPTTNAAAIAVAPTAQPVVALPRTMTTTVYLPIVSKPSGPTPPASPYAVALSQALAKCAGTTLNQVCYGRGSLTLVGGGPLTTPGQMATLDGVSGLKLVSPDASHWSVALLRLAADSPTPNLGLTVLAFGNVNIRNLTLFRTAAANGDVAPALSFSSSPVPGQDPMTGGIIVYNPNHEEPLFIRLNATDLTLASSAIVEAQPGAKMTVIMATGSAHVSTAAGDSALLQAHQLSVPLDGNGNAAGAPTTPTAIDDDLLVPLVSTDEDELLEPLVPRVQPTLPSIYDRLEADFDSAYDRCMAGDSRQVYRVMYFARLIKMYRAEYPDALLSQIDVQVSTCATFEIEFNSVISSTWTMASGSMHIQEQGMIVSYGMDGNLVQPAEMPLTHLRYDIVVTGMPCSYRHVLTDGVLHLLNGYMRINHNRLDISTKVYPTVIDEHTIFSCPDGTVDLPAYAYWRTWFMYLHSSEMVDSQMDYLFTPAHWKYTGNQILAEAIFSDRTGYSGYLTGDTWLVMLHRPGGN